MTQFASIWAIRSDKLLQLGQPAPVSLKNGGTKPVMVESLLYSKERKDGRTEYYYLPGKSDE